MLLQFFQDLLVIAFVPSLILHFQFTFSIKIILLDKSNKDVHISFTKLRFIVEKRTRIIRILITKFVIIWSILPANIKGVTNKVNYKLYLST